MMEVTEGDFLQVLADVTEKLLVDAAFPRCSNKVRFNARRPA